MKKKWIALIMAVALALTAAICLSACDKNLPEEKQFNLEITIKADGWSQGYDCIDSITGKGATFNSQPLKNQDSVCYNVSINENSAEICVITYKSGYDPSSVNVTEKEGKTFTKRVGSGDDANKLYIDISPNSDAKYEFALSKPNTITQYVNLDLDVKNIVSIVQATSHPVYNFLTNAQICVVSGNSESEQWVDIASLDKDGDLSQPLISNLKLKTDMSQDKAYLYIRFDKSNHKKFVYKISEINQLFKLKNANSQSVVLSTYRRQGSYKDLAFFDETKQAYRFEFNNSDLINVTSKIVLSDNLNDLKASLVYEEYDVNMNPVKFTLDENIEQSLSFSKVDSKAKKTYDTAATFQFNIVSDACNREWFDLQNFQFEIGGKKVTSTIDDYTVTFTLNAEESPFDYPSEKTDAFYIDVKKSSVDFEPYRVANTIKASKELGYHGSIDIAEGADVISKELINGGYSEYGINMVEIPIKGIGLYKSFKLKLKLGDGDYIEKAFASGVDFNIKGFDDAYADFIQNNDPINELSLLKYVAPKILWSSNGDAEGTQIGDFYSSSEKTYYKSNSFVAYRSDESQMTVMFNLPDKINMTVECYISDVVYTDTQISFITDDNLKDFEVKKDGVAVFEKDANVPNKYNLTEKLKVGTYKYEFTDSRIETLEEGRYIEYYYEIKLYSNNKLFYTADYQLNGDYKDGSKIIASDISANWEIESFYPIVGDWENTIKFGNDGSLTGYGVTLTSKEAFNSYNDKARVNVFIDKIEISIKSEIKTFEQV